MAGTLIRTPDGDVAVERLARDDHVLTHSGEVKPVLWVGARRLDASRHPRPETIWPIRIRAGAIAEGMPGRDLDLSPDHAVFLDGALIPAKVLVNGLSIAPRPTREIAYYHVEVEGHDVLLAEGLPVETYLDTGNRGLFEHSGGVIDLHPDLMQSRRELASCAAFAERGELVMAVRQRLLDRLGPVRASSDPDFRVRAGGDDLPVRRAGAMTYLVDLPSLSRPLELVSRTAVPAELTADPDDRRSLGVAVGELRLEDEAGTRLIDLAHPGLWLGWWGFEGTHRWTNGAAVIPAELLAGHSLAIRLSGTMTYRLAPDGDAGTDRSTATQRRAEA